MFITNTVRDWSNTNWNKKWYTHFLKAFIRSMHQKNKRTQEIGTYKYSMKKMLVALSKSYYSILQVQACSFMLRNFYDRYSAYICSQYNWVFCASPVL